MTAPATERGFDWEAAGRGLGESLGSTTTRSWSPGRIPSRPAGWPSASRARSPAHRRVAVGDLFAESPPIQRAGPGRRSARARRSFSYGISLTESPTRPVARSTLFVMPSGTEPPDYEEMLPNPRWHRLAARVSRGRRTAHSRRAGERARASQSSWRRRTASSSSATRFPPASSASSVVRDAARSRGLLRRRAASTRRARWSPSDRRATSRRQGRTSMPRHPLLSLIVIHRRAGSRIARSPAAPRASTEAGHRRTTASSPAPIAVQPPFRPPTAIDTDRPSTRRALVANPARLRDRRRVCRRIDAANTQAGAILKLQKDGKTAGGDLRAGS